MSSPRNGGHQRTQGNTTHNTTDKPLTALHSHRPLASGCRRGMQLHSNLQCGVRLLVSTSRTCIEKWHRLVRPIEPHCRRPSASGRRGVPVGRSGGRCGSTSLVGRGSGGGPAGGRHGPFCFTDLHINRRCVPYFNLSVILPAALLVGFLFVRGHASW